jgi:RNA polymerase sigma-70 factor (ECF subfamily)
MPEYSDWDMVEKALAGDMQAFRRLVERHQSFVYRLAYRFVGTVGDAEDITQESFVRLWKNLRRYTPEIKLTTWLYKIVTNLCLDLLKSKHHKHGKGMLALADDTEMPGSSGSDEAVLNEELLIAVRMISEHLSPKQKAVFVLRDMQGLTMEEIENILSMSAGKVKSNLYYARKKVGEMLEQYYQTKKTVKP